MALLSIRRGGLMCSCYLIGLNSQVFRTSLRCSTDADELYAQAQAIADREGMRIVGIEPCVLALRSAISRPEPLH